MQLSFLLYFYDRYNWNHDGNISFPKKYGLNTGNVLVSTLGLEEMEKMTAPNGDPYIYKEKGKNVFNNEFMGMPQELPADMQMPLATNPFEVIGTQIGKNVSAMPNTAKAKPFTVMGIGLPATYVYTED